MKQYREDHREELLKYRAEHREQQRAYQRKYLAKKPRLEKPFANPQGHLPDDPDHIYVTYHDIHNWLRGLKRAARFDATDMEMLFLGERRFYSGTPVRVYLYRPKNATVVGGTIDWGAAPVGKLTDVYGLFQMPWEKLCLDYGTDDLVAIMERTRSSLRSVHIGVSQSHWHRASAIGDWLMSELGLSAANIPRPNVPDYLFSRQKQEPIQGNSVFGYIEGPVYEYDINSSFGATTAAIPELSEYVQHLWNARQELADRQDPAARIMKLALTTISGKFGSGQKRYNRPDLMWYIRNTAVQKFYDAMNMVLEQGGMIYRWNTDGFVANMRIDNLDEGPDLGQWRIREYPDLTILGQNIFWMGDKYKLNGLRVRCEDVQNNPLKVPYERDTIDWRGDLEVHTERGFIERHSMGNWSKGSHLTPLGYEIAVMCWDNSDFFAMDRSSSGN
jgi:hypothetical protein